MDVAADTGPCGHAQVHADVETLGFEGALYGGGGAAEQFEDIRGLLIAQFLEPCHVPYGGDHEMTARIRVPVQHDGREGACEKDVEAGLKAFSGRLAEKAPSRLFRPYIHGAPWGPDPLHGGLFIYPFPYLFSRLEEGHLL